jgi:hypothetical protein
MVRQLMAFSDSTAIEELSSRDRISLAELALLGQSVRALFAELQIDIRPLSTLSVLLSRLDQVAEQWQRGEGQDVATMIDVTTALRVIEAILAAKEEPLARDCYLRIASKDVNLFSPAQSQGKDALWELQLLSILRLRGMTVSLGEPDLNVAIADLTIPIACKRIYSPKNLESQLRSAGSQLKRHGIGGIAALNIDAQLPVGHLIVTATTLDASRVLQREAQKFLIAHQSVIRRMIKAGKFDAVLVSVSCPMDNLKVRPRFNVGTESFLWSPIGVATPEATMRIELLRMAMNLPVTASFA